MCPSVSLHERRFASRSAQFVTLVGNDRFASFALYKLTRAGHDNDNFGPALRDFAGEYAGVSHSGNEHDL